MRVLFIKQQIWNKGETIIFINHHGTHKEIMLRASFKTLYTLFEMTVIFQVSFEIIL